MRQFVCFLAVGVLSQTALANPVIDDFLDAVSPNPLIGGTDVQVISVEQTVYVEAQPADITSTRTVTTSAGSSVTIGGGTISLTTVGVGESLLLSYAGISAPVSLVDGFLRTNFFGPSVAGMFDVAVTLTSGASSSTVTKSIGGPVVASLHTDFRDDEFLPAAIGAIDGIDILITQTGGIIGSFASTPGNLQAIPEPSSYVLLGLTSLIGFVAFRRRQNAVEAA
ncbi:PEP-CTERM sorting domain-containing protein [Fuerstiella marisgermanici]|uniref:Ice-binding protein C-terminal domain-containing protein n=1 Tax=Fuerstiella marisgermanici TaxID=1891926 RepID=A0A1P8WPD3_9PLAN|nr:PEP-CTERM sorting domain-containing protein [Fuerstiella marisgermanici]APZ95919.1 hypothetical protein Fuma_05582 [Fuerstiella marisgermanici]